jgi:hypothetical protein
MRKTVLLAAVAAMLVVAISPTVAAAPKKEFETQCVSRNPSGTFQEGPSKSPKDDTCIVIAGYVLTGNSMSNQIQYDDTVEYHRDGSTTLLDRTVNTCRNTETGQEYADPYHPDCAIDVEPDPYPPL